jgi:hypothetical protein
MVNSANTECLLCGALARGHFVPIPEVHTDSGDGLLLSLSGPLRGKFHQHLDDNHLADLLAAWKQQG